MPVCVIIRRFDGSMKFHPGLGGNLTVLVHSLRFFDDDERTIAMHNPFFFVFWP